MKKFVLHFCGFMLLLALVSSCKQNLVQDHKVPAKGVVNALGFGGYSPYQFLIRNTEIVVIKEDVVFGVNIWVDDLTDTLPGAIMSAEEADNNGAFEADYWQKVLKSRNAKFAFEWLDGESTVGSHKVQWCLGKSVIIPGKGSNATHCECRADSVASIVTEERQKETHSLVRIVGYQSNSLIDLASGIRELGIDSFALSYSKSVAITGGSVTKVNGHTVGGSINYKLEKFKDTISTANAVAYDGSLNNLQVEGEDLQKFLDYELGRTTKDGERIIFILYEDTQKHVFIIDGDVRLVR